MQISEGSEDKTLHTKSRTQSFSKKEIFLAVCLSKRYTNVPEVVFAILCKDYQGKLTTLSEPLHRPVSLTAITRKIIE